MKNKKTGLARKAAFCLVVALIALSAVSVSASAQASTPTFTIDGTSVTSQSPPVTSATPNPDTFGILCPSPQVCECLGGQCTAVALESSSSCVSTGATLPTALSLPQCGPMQGEPCIIESSDIESSSGSFTFVGPVGTSYPICFYANTIANGWVTSTATVQILSPSSTPTASKYGSGTFCSNLFGLPQYHTSLSANSILGLALLMMLLMLNIAALTYLIGSAFRIGRVINFGRTEIGEVALTALIVLIFIGAFQVGNTLPPPGNYLAVSNTVLSGSGVFTSDCVQFAGAGLTVLGDIVPVWVAQNWNLLISSQSLTFTWSDFGWSDSPLRGLQFAAFMYGPLVNILFAMVSIPFAGAIVLALFYYIAPIFLFLGILLRTLPFTRAAGGAFLGMFAAFYILFPLLIFLLMSQASVSTIAVSTPSLQSVLTGLGPQVPVIPTYADTGAGVVIDFAQYVIPQILYIAFAFLLSLVISFDFMEAVGDLLGAPSLSASSTLRNII